MRMQLRERLQKAGKFSRCPYYRLWIVIGLLLCLCNGFHGAKAEQAVDSAGKVLVVLVFDQTCKAWCSNVRPVMKDLQAAYGDQVAFAELDATDNLVRQTEQKAKELGIRGFFDDARGYVPVVQIFTRTRKLAKELPGPKEKDTYKAAIDKAIKEK